MLSRGTGRRLAPARQFIDSMAFKPSPASPGVVPWWDYAHKQLLSLGYLNLTQALFIEHNILMDVRLREEPSNSSDIIDSLIDRHEIKGLSTKTVQQSLVDIRFQEKMVEEVQEISLGIDEILRAACERRSPEAITFVTTPENHFSTGFPISQRELTQIVSGVYRTLSSVGVACGHPPLHFHLSNLLLHITAFESLLGRAPRLVHPHIPEVLNCTIVGQSGTDISVQVYVKQMIDPGDIHSNHNKLDSKLEPEDVDPRRVVSSDDVVFTCDTCLEFRAAVGALALARQLTARENPMAVVGYHSVTANTLGPISGLESVLLLNSSFPLVFMNDQGAGPSVSVIEGDCVRQLPIVGESPPLQNPRSKYARGMFVSFPRIELLPPRQIISETVELFRNDADETAQAYRQNLEQLKGSGQGNLTEDSESKDPFSPK